MSFHELPELRNRICVFRDRRHAGEVLAGMLTAYRGGRARVLAIPAGGVPVAAPIAEVLLLALDVVVVSKITPPWNREVGYGAVAFDGSVRLNQALTRRMGLGESEVERGIQEAREKVQRRVARLRGGQGSPALAETAILVDDGLASGFTMRAAVRALRSAGARRIALAVPTGSLRSIEALRPQVEELYCANVRAGSSFAVADAYERWSDVDESDAEEILEQTRTRRAAGRSRSLS